MVGSKNSLFGIKIEEFKLQVKNNPFTTEELNIPVPGTLRYRLSGFDQFINSCIGKGNNDQTFSARCWEAEHKLGGKWTLIRAIVDKIFWFEKDHCWKSFWVDSGELTYPDIEFKE